MAVEGALGITDGRLSRALGYGFSDFFGMPITLEHQDAEGAIRADRDIPEEHRELLASLVWLVKRGTSPEELGCSGDATDEVFR